MWYFYQLLCIITIIVTAHIGDNLLENVRTPVYKAFADNITHALIGFLGWNIVSLNIKYSNTLYLLVDSILCLLIASLIDMDHFCAAKSISLQDATSLNHRPFLHLSTLPLTIILVLLGWAHSTNNVYMEKIALIMFVAFGTHHTRDAYRRGYWLAPFGSTPPFSYFCYLLITILIPYGVVLWCKYFKLSRRLTTITMTDYSDDVQYLVDV